MKRGPESEETRSLVVFMEKSARRSGAPIWKSVASRLGKPRRARPAVNLSKINRHAKEGEMVLVPGKVLGSGEITRALTIGAAQFSSSALAKIKKAGGKAVSLQGLVGLAPKGTNVRIIV
ncbi:MAG: 50S ribosomal protein L18e [Candidatus Micrarchaeota archaeon]